MTGPARGRLAAPIAVALGAMLALGGVSAAQPDGGRPLPAEGGPLEPGTYVTTVLGPRLRLSLGNGWRLTTPAEGPVVVLERVDVPGGVLTLTHFRGDVFADACDPTSLTWVEPSAARLVEIIAGERRLEAEEPETVVLAGLPGISLDVSTPPLEDCSLPFLLLWAIDMDGGEFVQVPGQQARFIVLDVGGDVLVVALETLPDVPFASFAAAAADVLSDLAIEPVGAGPSASP